MMGKSNKKTGKCMHHTGQILDQGKGNYQLRFPETTLLLAGILGFLLIAEGLFPCFDDLLLILLIAEGLFPCYHGLFLNSEGLFP